MASENNENTTNILKNSLDDNTENNTTEITSINLLLNSLNELEKVIWNARITVNRKNYPTKGIIERLDSYDSVLIKQKKLAVELVKFIDEQNWEETNRHISLINGLSVLVRDDAKALLEIIDYDNDSEESLVC